MPLVILVGLAGCAAEQTQVPPAIDPASASARESPSNVSRPLAGPVSPEASPLDKQAPDARQPDAGGEHDMSGMAGHDMGGMKHDEGGQATKPSETIYTCPMHPEVRQNKPGNCPKCGMKLVPVDHP